MVQKYKKTETPKMDSKVLYELLIRSYERFKYFSEAWNWMIAKNTGVNQRKSKHHEKFEFQPPKYPKILTSKNNRKTRLITLSSKSWAFFLFFSLCCSIRMILCRIRTLFFSLRDPAIALHQQAREALELWRIGRVGRVGR